jgi:Na+/H+ antiporter NhaD/arsenite permease-like protein
VANVIVVESARGHVEIGFWDYAKIGVPITLATIAPGTILLLLIG